MATGVTVDVSKALAKLRLVGSHLAPRDLLSAIGQRHLNWINQNLRGAGIEKKWATMKPATIAARPQRQSSSHFSSRYQSQLQQTFVVNVGTTSVEVGTNLQYARFHHEGTRHIPSRALLPSERIGQELAEGVINAVVARIRQEGST